jgi:hypothetical protein
MTVDGPDDRTKLRQPRTEPKSPRALADEIVMLLDLEERASTNGSPELRLRAAREAAKAALRLSHLALRRLEDAS